jgi:putative FmdB family regulatory protein
MPIYAYKCSACKHELDALQKISDAPLTLCPKCGAAALAKQLTAAGFQLKGSGWYATDFKNAGAKPDTKPETNPEAKPEAKPGDGSAAQPADAAPAVPVAAKDAAAPAAPAASGAGG